MPKFPYPENPAPTEAKLIDVIKRRWSPLAFSAEPIEPEKMEALFEAMRWTQSSRNEQPWRVIYATKENPEDFSKLSSLLSEGNEYAKNAYLLLLICAMPNYVYQDKPNRMHQHDAGAASHAIFLQAVGMGLIAHQMGGFDQEAAYELLDIPNGVPLMSMMAVGYPGDESKIDKEKLSKRYKQSRERKEVSTFVFKGKWKKI